MTLKRFIPLIILTLYAVTAAAQSQLTFSCQEWDFVTIREADGPVSHTFTGENTGDRPLVILDVVTSCGCTVPDFSKRPILPGQKADIGVRFDPANRPGSFSKELTVYSTERKKIGVLRIRGTVLPRERSVEERYPLDAGGGIRLNTGLCAFAYVQQGRRVESTVGIVNTTQKSLSLELFPEEQSGLLTTEAPQQLAPGQEAEIVFSYYIPQTEPRYGTLRDVLGIRIDGRTSRIPLVVHGIGVDPMRTPAGGGTGPRAQLDRNTLKFDVVRRGGGPVRRTVTLSNEGDAPLRVRCVESEKGFTWQLRPGTTLSPGESLATEVHFDPARADYGVQVGHLMLITDDPVRPMRKLRVTAIIEE